MPRSRQVERRKHLIILIIALFLALAILLIQAETASAGATLVSGTPADTGLVHQGDDDSGQGVVTTERLLLLGMLGLVGATWLYLRLRPTPRAEQEPHQERPPEQK